MSSLYRYFSPSSKPYLPNLEEEKTSKAKETKVVNQEVEKTLSASGCRQRKRKSNFYYDPETRARSVGLPLRMVTREPWRDFLGSYKDL